MNKSENIGDLAKALAKVQFSVENATKNAKNPHFKSNYADLAEILNTVREILAENEIAVVQMPTYAEGVASVETMLVHSSGQFVANVASCRVTKDDAQGVGSAITYLRRYSLAGFVGIAQEDDDGNAATGKNSAPETKKKDDSTPSLDALRKAFVILTEAQIKIKGTDVLFNKVHFDKFISVKFGKNHATQMTAEEIATTFAWLNSAGKDGIVPPEEFTV